MPTVHDRAAFREIKKSLVHDPEFERSPWVGTAVPSPARRRRIRNGIAVAALLAGMFLVIVESFGTAVLFLGAAIAFAVEDRAHKPAPAGTEPPARDRNGTGTTRNGGRNHEDSRLRN
ncbi:DUF3040 domain-containing protein [Actinophytocola sp. KF-1]